jgi:hypothetical protein
MAKKQNQSDGRVLQSKALAEIKNKYPWAPVASIRKAIREGLIPSIRSSSAEKARYYVNVRDVESWLLSTQRTTS